MKTQKKQRKSLQKESFKLYYRKVKMNMLGFIQLNTLKI